MSSNKMRYLAIIAILGLFACDPVKRAVKRQEIVDKAVADYVARNPPRKDTVYVPGAERIKYDTIVNENIYVDTIRVHDTVYIRKIKYQDVIKTIMRVDTMYQVVSNDAAVQGMRDLAQRANERAKVAKDKADSLRTAVLILLAIIVSTIGLFIMKR